MSEPHTVGNANNNLERGTAMICAVSLLGLGMRTCRPKTGSQKYKRSGFYCIWAFLRIWVRVWHPDLDKIPKPQALNLQPEKCRHFAPGRGSKWSLRV